MTTRMSAKIINNIMSMANARRYMNNVNNWTEVFIFARKVTFVAFRLLFLALKSLSALTQISLEMIKAPAKPII